MRLIPKNPLIVQVSIDKTETLETKDQGDAKKTEKLEGKTE